MSNEQTNQRVRCAICTQDAFRKLSIGSIEHHFCAFHAGFIQALEGLFKEHYSHWSLLNDA